MFGSFFKPVPRWDMDRAKQHLAQHRPDTYNLVDVRQPGEFAQEHLPGATSIPLAELPSRLGELDRTRPTLVYCHSGGRAASATALLVRAGFEQAHSIGGISQWRGLVASGPPEAAMAVFDPARSPAEYVAVAWTLEEEARLFYLDLGQHFGELKALFDKLAGGEQHHRDLLARLHHELSGHERVPAVAGAAGKMEGGIDRAEALAWARQRPAVDVLEFTAAMEANAHDRYIQVGRGVGGQTEHAFVELAEAEKTHLVQLLEAFEQHLRPMP